MKVFIEEKGKETVFVQYKDLRFLCNSNQTPNEIKSLIPMCAFSLTNEEEYMEFEDENFIKYLKQVYFILDLNKFNEMSNEDIDKIYNDNVSNIIKIENKLKKLNKKERMKEIGTYEALSTLNYYKKEIEEYLKLKKENSLEIKKYINN